MEKENKKTLRIIFLNHNIFNRLTIKYGFNMNKKIVILFSLVVLAGGCKSTEQVQEKPQIKQEIIEEVKVPDRIYFGFDRYDLNSKSKKALDLQSEWLKQDDSIKVIIEGHCDERGTREYNLALGQKRANAAKEYLVNKGVSKRRIKTVSFGKERPEYLGSTESAWGKNRRSVTVVKD